MAALRCSKVRENLSAYLDGELSPQTRLLVEDHLVGCAACRAEAESLKATAALVRSLPRSEPPEDFHAVLTQRVRAETAAMAGAASGGSRRRGVSSSAFADFWANIVSGLRHLPYRGVAVAAVVLALLVWAGGFAYYMGFPVPGGSLLGLKSDQGGKMLTAGDYGGAAPPVGSTGSANTLMADKAASLPGGSGSGSVAFETDEGRGGGAPGAAGQGAGTGAGGGTFGALAAGSEAGRKFILNIYLNLECQDVNEARVRAVAAAEAAGGFVESLNYWTDKNGATSASLVLRVPPASLSSVLEQIRALGRILSEQACRQDVTAQHIDLSARVNNLRLQEQTLLALLGRAESLGDIFALQNELTRIRTEIETYESQLRYLNEQIDLSTINLNLQSAGVGPGPEAGLWDRVVDAFLKSLRWMGELAGKLVILLATIVAPAAVFGALAWAVLTAVRARRRRPGV